MGERTDGEEMEVRDGERKGGRLVGRLMAEGKGGCLSGNRGEEGWLGPWGAAGRRRDKKRETVVEGGGLAGEGKLRGKAKGKNGEMGLL